MSRSPVRHALALALASALAVAACGGDDDAPADAAPTTDATEPAADAGPEVSRLDPDDVVADATFTMPGTDDEVRIGVVGVFVTDEAMELRLVVTPGFDDDGEPVRVYDLLQNGTGVIPTTLIDRQNLKEYTVLREGSSRRYETDPLRIEAAAGETVGWQRFFAPPEDDIDVIDVKVHDRWPTFADVPLTDER